MTASNVHQVRSFWQDRAQEPVNENEVTHPDIWQRWLEVEQIKALLAASDRVIEVGCGNGYTTTQIAPLVNETVGIDCSEAMIERAMRAQQEDGQVAGKVTFETCDVLELNPEKFGLFDVAISERCLINLGSRDEQQRAIENIAGVLKQGGRFLFVEGSMEGRRRLNAFRQSVGLEPMPEVWYNVDFDEDELPGFVERYFVLEQRLHFGLYDLISRVVHPLLVAPDQPDYKARINQVAARLALKSQACGDMSRVLFLVLRKKS